jgi:hypothetical protein
MSPSEDHEWVKSMLGHLLQAYAEERGIELGPFGSVTLKDERRRRGAEGDQTYVLGPRPERIGAPDLVVEVVLTSGGVDKLSSTAGSACARCGSGREGGSASTCSGLAATRTGPPARSSRTWTCAWSPSWRPPTGRLEPSRPCGTRFGADGGRADEPSPEWAAGGSYFLADLPSAPGCPRPAAAGGGGTSSTAGGGSAGGAFFGSGSGATSSWSRTAPAHRVGVEHLHQLHPLRLRHLSLEHRGDARVGDLHGPEPRRGEARARMAPSWSRSASGSNDSSMRRVEYSSPSKSSRRAARQAGEETATVTDASSPAPPA